MFELLCKIKFIITFVDRKNIFQIYNYNKEEYYIDICFLNLFDMNCKGLE